MGSALVLYRLDSSFRVLNGFCKSINVNIFKKLFILEQLVLKYPAFNSRIRKHGGKTQIFDFIRRKWCVLSPEEWVRQHLLNYLVRVKKYPASIISVEKELQLNDLKKRYDVVVYDKALKPFLVVECKAPYIELGVEVLEQAQRYNLILKAPWLMVTNGIADAVFNENRKVELLEDYT